MKKTAKIYVAGHRGLVGSALVRKLRTEGYTDIITQTHGELDLTRQDRVETFFKEEKPDYVNLGQQYLSGAIYLRKYRYPNQHYPRILSL